MVNKTYFQEECTHVLYPECGSSITIDEELWDRLCHAKRWTMIMYDKNEHSFIFQTDEGMHEGLQARIAMDTGISIPTREQYQQAGLWHMQNIAAEIVEISLHE